MVLEVKSTLYSTPPGTWRLPDGLAIIRVNSGHFIRNGQTHLPLHGRHLQGVCAVVAASSRAAPLLPEGSSPARGGEKHTDIKHNNSSNNGCKNVKIRRKVAKNAHLDNLVQKFISLPAPLAIVDCQLVPLLNISFGQKADFLVGVKACSFGYGCGI